MIHQLRLRNFKCFEDASIQLRGLTLLAGLNSSGKSTVLQSLLLLRQSYLERLLPDRGLTLNGEFVQIGTAKDALFEEADEDELGIEIVTDNDSSLQLRFGYRKESDVLEILEPAVAPGLWDDALFQDNFQYLRAERLGPRTSFQISDFAVRHHRQLGTSGEFTAHFLSVFGSEPLESNSVLHEAASSSTLLSQVEAWMTEVSPGLRLSLKRYSEMDLMSLNVSYVLGHQVASSEYRPTNVGFGITYALPIVVSVLAARPGSLLIIENPEAHLHPKGQVKLGELLARAAAGGVQIVIETHSDHILNGIRLAVRRGHVPPNVVALYHSRWRDAARSPTMSLIDIRPDGRLSEWPDGFFDEMEKSLDQLLGL